MFGVVLWSDQIRKRAVIWCEDHGDLAFFKGDGLCMLDGAGMDAGDLVQFEVSEDRHMRLARNPRLVASDEYPNLAGDLKKAGTAVPAEGTPIAVNGAKVITFEPKPANSVEMNKPARRVV